MLQELSPGFGRNGVYRFNLAQLVDTIAHHPQVQLCLSDDGALRVATIRPKRLYRDLALSEGKLAFSECVDTDGLTALAYPMHAPWREPAVLPVVHGAADLPACLSMPGRSR